LLSSNSQCVRQNHGRLRVHGGLRNEVLRLLRGRFDAAGLFADAR
jgi:hypothetical protein